MRLMFGVAAAIALVAAGHATAGAEAAAQPASSRAPTAARGADNPRAFIEAVYRSEMRGARIAVEHVYSNRLRELFAGERRDAGDGIGRLDFDFWSNSQDPEIGNVRVTEEEVEGRQDRRIVVANFTNGGQPLTHRFYFERTNGRWYIDDVRNEARPGGGDSGWTLSLLLKYGN